MTDVADDCLVAHALHLRAGDDVIVTGGRDDDIDLVADVVKVDDAVAFHRCLERADRIDFGDPDDGAECAQRLRGALADIAKAADDSDLAGDHHVGRTLDGVDQRFTAAVQVVEFGLGDRVVDVEGRAHQRAVGHHVVQALDARRGFFGKPLDVLHQLRVLVVQDHGQVAAVVEDHVRLPAVRAVDRLLDAPPVLVFRFAFPGKNRNAGGRNRRRGVILGREDVA